MQLSKGRFRTEKISSYTPHRKLGTFCFSFLGRPFGTNQSPLERVSPKPVVCRLHIPHPIRKLRIGPPLPYRNALVYTGFIDSCYRFIRRMLREDKFIHSASKTRHTLFVFFRPHRSEAIYYPEKAVLFFRKLMLVRTFDC